MKEIDNNSRILSRKKVDILVFSKSGNVLQRVQEVALQFRFSREVFATSSEYIENIYDFSKAPIIVLEDPADVQRVAAASKNSSLILLVEKVLAKEEVQTLFNQGLYAVMTFNEFFMTPKFEFICLQKIRAAYYPISLYDIYPSTEMSFHASIRLPLNQKYLSVIFRGFVLTEEKFKKIEKEGRLFVKGHEVIQFLGYIKQYNDCLGAGLKKRCRALFLVFSYQLFFIYENLFFDGVADRKTKQSKIFEDLERTLAELNEYLGQSEGVDLWEVFKDVTVNEVFNHWRAPWHVLYAGLICHKTGQGNPMNAMFAACFSDLGMMDLDAPLFFEYVHKGPKDLTLEQNKELQKHPILSLNRCLSRELPINDTVKAIIVCTHERQDQKGYPNQTPAENIPIEAWVIQYAELIDLGVRSLSLDSNASFKFLRKVVWERSVVLEGAFPAEVSKAFLACTT